MLDLRCLKCYGTLSRAPSSLVCQGCGAEWRAAEGIPILVEDLSAQHESQRRYFDAEFGSLGEYRIENWRRSHLDSIFRELEIPHGGGAYLDIGVGGSGATVIEAARGGVEAWGCDLSLEAVARARAFAASEGVETRADFVVCTAEALPFPSQSFRAVSAVALLEHLTDDRPAVAEIARVLTIGGLVWILVPHAFRYMPPPVWPVYWFHDRRIGHQRHYSDNGLRYLFETHGFEHVSSTYTAHPVKVLQYGLGHLMPSLERPDSKLWWWLEGLDRRAGSRPYGAIHLTAVYRKARDVV